METDRQCDGEECGYLDCATCYPDTNDADRDSGGGDFDPDDFDHTIDPDGLL
jgi:hypothetical protein